MLNHGDIVKSGDILIRGVMTSKNGEDRLVSAKGSVLIKTWYETKMKFPYERDIVSKSGRKENSYILEIKNSKINLGNNDTKFEKYDTINSCNNLVLLGRFVLPIKLTKIVREELCIDTLKYTKEQAILNAKNEVTNNVVNKLCGSGEVVNTKVDVVEDEDGIITMVTVECIENVGIKRKLEE